MMAFLYIVLILMSICRMASNEKTLEKRILLNDPNILHVQIQALEGKVQDLTAKYLNQATTILDLKTTLQAEKFTVSNQTATINDLKKNLQTAQRDLSDLTSKYNTLLSTSKYEGGVFVRWGRKTCPDNGTELVYTGSAGGSWYDSYGAAAEFVCLPHDPDLISKFSSDNARMYGAEYDTTDFGHDVGDDIPCSVCRSKYETSVVMIPGKNRCYSSWRKQYSGYLVSGHRASKSATQYICLDENPEALPAGHDNDDGRLIFPVKAICGSLPCPPYHDNRYLTCVVCTK